MNLIDKIKRLFRREPFLRDPQWVASRVITEDFVVYNVRDRAGSEREVLDLSTLKWAPVSQTKFSASRIPEFEEHYRNQFMNARTLGTEWQLGDSFDVTTIKNYGSKNSTSLNP